MKTSNRKLMLFVCWLIVLVSHIATCAAGETPGWISVFCPVGLLVFQYFMEFLDAKSKGD